MDSNPYAPPRAAVAEPALVEPREKSSVGARFLWTLAISFPVYMFFVLFAPAEKWLVGALGALCYAAFSGCLAMCIPARRKAWFIIPPILANVILAIILGLSSS